ncbi:hypothetical protein BDP55DRAFT_648741 [Colletotrichum godetiae]|uniref:Uncharacterized protein n=1 Tax=Colletotrichum godetiae TaxID=1209918 RepID=A0AAJ0AXK4_9PEZI|nr:uncharacterized protein BDP55DRAFT_648741 [Colletotrichum godetiae]KAK1690871.1 hypothetical protein BDP55DRAFT_648741 [Colletotrichum godetiae]
MMMSGSTSRYVAIFRYASSAALHPLHPLPATLRSYSDPYCTHFIVSLCLPIQQTPRRGPFWVLHRPVVQLLHRVLGQSCVALACLLSLLGLRCDAFPIRLISVLYFPFQMGLHTRPACRLVAPSKLELRNHEKYHFLSPSLAGPGGRSRPLPPSYVIDTFHYLSPPRHITLLFPCSRSAPRRWTLEGASALEGCPFHAACHRRT